LNADFSRAITRLNARAIIDNRVHARFEVTNEEGLSLLQDLMREGAVSLVSVMDHTPGQGQYTDDSKFIAWLMSGGKSKEEAIEILTRKQKRSLASWPTVEAFVRTACECNLPVASHDDDLPDKVHALHKLGVRIAEFPMTKEAADTAMQLGHTVLMGSPNVVRGGSTGTGPKAMDLIASGGANSLCSDYMPATILPAIFKISEELGWPLWQAARLATATPAEGVGLHDRGEIAVGKRADLILVEFHHDWPIVRHLWSAGHLAYASIPVESAANDPVALGL
jgi:alpha-D-ribose 1-methylphosphonate 5-triphosphate diphosphatase